MNRHKKIVASLKNNDPIANRSGPKKTKRATKGN
jgi:hypothetical protein